MRNPKGVPIITAVHDEYPSELTWSISTIPDKTFYLRAPTLEEKQKFILVMHAAVNAQQISMKIEGPSKLVAAIEWGRNGYVDKAKVELMELAQSEPDNCSVLFHLGTCHLVEGNEFNAIEIYSQAVKAINPQSNQQLFIEIMNNLGLAHFITGNFTAAKFCFNEIRRQLPNDEDTLINLSVVHIECGEFVDAERLLFLCFNNEKPKAQALLNWAIVMKATGKKAAGMESLKKLVNLYPDAHDAHYMLGEIYIQNGELLKAAELFELALSLHSSKIIYAQALASVKSKIAEISALEDDKLRSVIR